MEREAGEEGSAYTLWNPPSPWTLPESGWALCQAVRPRVSLSSMPGSCMTARQGKTSIQKSLNQRAGSISALCVETLKVLPLCQDEILLLPYTQEMLHHCIYSIVTVLYWLEILLLCESKEVQTATTLHGTCEKLQFSWRCLKHTNMKRVSKLSLVELLTSHRHKKHHK